LIFAFRYALGRQTYAVDVVSKAVIANWNAMLLPDRKLIHSEIRHAIETDSAGSSYDIDMWNKVLALPV
jgi:hypothetical protein